MKAVCNKYGALLILDEVMCGMGRTGTTHAWQQEDVVPDIQTIGKGLGAGYVPIAGFLAGHRVINALNSGTGLVHLPFHPPTGLSLINLLIIPQTVHSRPDLPSSSYGLCSCARSPAHRSTRELGSECRTDGKNPRIETQECLLQPSQCWGYPW